MLTVEWELLCSARAEFCVKVIFHRPHCCGEGGGSCKFVLGRANLQEVRVNCQLPTTAFSTEDNSGVVWNRRARVVTHARCHLEGEVRGER